MEIVTPRDHDAAAIQALLRAAFGQQDEADLVEALRRDRDLAAELVAVIDARIAGYVALSRMQSPDGWLCLAPLAVQPERQGRGIGGAMVRASLDVARAPVVVLGPPDYYARFGFDQAAARNLTTPYRLSHTLLTGIDGAPYERLVHPAAFG